MTITEQHEYWLKFHRFQQRWENIYTPKVRAALRKQIKEYTSTGTLMAVTIDPIHTVLSSLYRTVSPIWAAASTVGIRNLKKRAPIGFNERIIELMRQYYEIDLLNMSDDITATTKDVITRVLAQAALDGIGFDEMVARLEAPELTASRARLIARTEVVAASNAASNIAAIETGLLMDKIWIAAYDNRTRLHHAEVNQHTVGMREDFTVGGMPMAFPGDKRGGASNCVNCRCTHAFIPKRDKGGRVIRQ